MTVEIFEGMILAENPHVSSEHSLASETLQMSRLTNGEAEIGLHKPNNQVQCQGSNGRCGNLGFDGTNGRPCRDENCGKEDIGVSSRDASTDVLSVSGAFTHIQNTVSWNKLHALSSLKWLPLHMELYYSAEKGNTAKGNDIRRYVQPRPQWWWWW